MKIIDFLKYIETLTLKADTVVVRPGAEIGGSDIAQMASALLLKRILEQQSRTNELLEKLVEQGSLIDV